ncbi:MAG: phosphodiester glycosidase family protein [candidate division KSB1 bacterium]|jgi:hypothetical protein|nr:phosphodiester glycosidase family protein [candidate division KSB1 bacterium]
MKYKALHGYLVLILLLSTAAAKAEQWVKEDVAIGIIHHHIIRDDGPWVIHVLQVDLKEPSVDLKTHKALNLRIGREKTSTMAISSDKKFHRVAGAINGDFFSIEGIPEGAQVADGKIVSSPNRWTAFGVTSGRKPFIEILNLNAKVIAENGAEFKVDDINSERLTDNLILYNSYNGAATGTNRWGAEVVIRLMTKHTVNDTMRGVVDFIEDLNGDIQIPTNGIVLSGHDAARDFLMNNMERGDTLQVIVNLRDGDDPIENVVGGVPRIVRDGVVSVEHGLEGISDKFALDRHPRTAAGISKDSTQVFLIVVDGRQPGYSLGMSLYELSDFMVELGVYQGVNLDGGGSTTMVVNNQVVNQPSDASGERPVGNALLVIIGASEKNE